MNVYDAENRLSKVTRTSQASDSTEETFVQENLYNGEGQRIQKKEGAKVTNYFYQDGVVSYTTDANETEKVIQNLLGLEGNIILAEKKLEESDENSDSHNYYLYNKDIQGSTVSILDETGAGELSYTYDDFGETEIHGNSSFENEICYTGGIYDASTGLYYLNARYYDPATGGFLTEDTYRGELEEPDTLHLYAYCKNNPVSYVDPSGHAFVLRRWMVAAPFDAVFMATSLGAVYAPVKYLCKNFGKKFATKKLKNTIFKFAYRLQRFGKKIGLTVYNAARKIPVAKKYISKKIVTKISSMVYSFAAKQTVYRFAGVLVKNIDIALSMGGLLSGMIDYNYDKKINNVLWRSK